MKVATATVTVSVITTIADEFECANTQDNVLLSSGNFSAINHLLTFIVAISCNKNI